jgi:ubiquitin-protein ligase
MNIARIQTEFSQARTYFEYLELFPTTDGKLYVKVVLQPTSQHIYVAEINFPDSYPVEMPRVYIRTPMLDPSPHRYDAGNICFLHPSMWNPGVHNLSFVIQRTAKWLGKYEIWKQNRAWPGASLRH